MGNIADGRAFRFDLLAVELCGLSHLRLCLGLGRSELNYLNYFLRSGSWNICWWSYSWLWLYLRLLFSLLFLLGIFFVFLRHDFLRLLSFEVDVLVLLDVPILLGNNCSRVLASMLLVVHVVYVAITFLLAKA